MAKIYVPSSGPASWRHLLAEPDKHWREGFSAMSLAKCWEAADGLPPEVAQLFAGHAEFDSSEPELLMALPEWKVALPGGRRSSQSDIFALVRCGEQIIAATVEGKVAEPFDKTVEAWLLDASDGKRTRLDHIGLCLGMTQEIPGKIRYQLLHRAASAVMEARRFGASAAAMIVHSFSPQSLWFDDFAEFCRIFDAKAVIGRLVRVRARDGLPLYLGWATGNQHFLKS